MRHLAGVVLAIGMAAVVFFAASWGYLKLLIGPAPPGALPAGGGSLVHNHLVLEGFGALLGVGLIAGLLIAVPRISPLAAGLPGLVLLAWTGLYLFSVRHAVQHIPLAEQARRDRARAVRGQHGQLPRSAGHRDHASRQRPALRLDADQAASA